MLDDPNFQGVRDDLEGMDERELRDQIERAHMVNQLSEHPGWRMFCDYLKSLTTTIQMRVLSGRCESLEEYRFLTGQVSGMLTAMKAPEELLARIAQIQELVEQARQDLSEADE